MNVNAASTATDSVDFEISNNTFTLDDTNLTHNIELKIYDDGFLEGSEKIILDYVMNNNGGDVTIGNNNQDFTLTIGEAEIAPTSTMNIETLEEFEVSGSLGSFTTINPSGDTPFQQGSTTTASSQFFTVPSGTNVAYINDDDCDCDQSDVRLISPSYDLSTCQNATLDFDLYFEGNTYQGNTEIGKLQVSLNGGAWTDIQTFTGVDDLWQNLSVDLSTYLGNADVKFAFHYNDGGGWLYGLVVDNFKLTCASALNIQTNVNTPTEQYFGPNGTVHFYDSTTGDIMLTLINNTNFDYGCTTVEVDRQGTTPTTHPFTTNNISDYLMSKTFQIIPTNDDPNGSYDISLYYQLNEVTAWETETGEQRTDATIVKVAGLNQIQNVNPSNFNNFNIVSEAPTISSFGSDLIFTATFNSGFSGFGIGLPVNVTGIIDGDSDGIADGVDNCPNVSNPGQENSDGDSFGAVCDCNDNDPNDDNIIINNNPITANIYEANTSINSAGTILTQTSFTAFYAGETIYMNPGFVAEAGSDFLAKIQDCGNAPQPLQMPVEDNLLIVNDEIKNSSTDELKTDESKIGSLQLAIVPNPLENKTTIFYNLPKTDDVNLSIVDTRGILQQQIINNVNHSAGQFQKPIDASNLSSGVYIVVLKVGNNIISERMVIIK